MLVHRIKNMTHIQSLLKSFPNRSLNLELTNACNLHCPLCSTGSGFNKKPKGMMGFDNFSRFIDICSPLIDVINLSGAGEPFMHSSFTHFVAYATLKKDKIVTCHTNGTLLSNPEDIVRCGLQRIFIDIDGITTEQHGMYRRGADLAKILLMLKELIKARRLLHSRFPLIYLNTLVSRYNEIDHDRFIKLGRELGCTGIVFVGIHDDMFQSTDWFPETPRYKGARRLTPIGCDFRDTMVGCLCWNGDIDLCCMTPNHNSPMVKLNAFEHMNLLELLDSDRFYSQTKLAGKYPFCKTCVRINHNPYSEKVRFRLFDDTRFSLDKFVHGHSTSLNEVLQRIGLGVRT
jgi:pyruvate-formate lyase-activating enzyme